MKGHKKDTGTKLHIVTDGLTPAEKGVFSKGGVKRW